MDDFERLTLPENLNFAWIKAKQMVRVADGFTSQAELSAFELNLEQELHLIREQLLRGDYSLTPLLPLPRPKKINNDGECVDRQYFHIHLRDQIAWIALVNVLGPVLDQCMPAWSYGNRLYRPAWYEENENRKSELEIGPYRHSSGHIYRKFQHSWPLFRRHVALTARVMSSGNLPDVEDRQEADELAIIAASKAGLPYLKSNFWAGEHKTEISDYNLYCCSIDLKQFYPSINLKVIESILVKNADLSLDNRLPFSKIVNSLISFKLDTLGFSDQELKNCVPEFNPNGIVTGLPTGLFVAGFLSNIAMSEIDDKVNIAIQDNRNIAHFRFVDDHTIIAKSFDELVKWVEWYEKIIASSGVGIEVNQEKYDPESFGGLLRERISNLGIETDKDSEQERCHSEALRDTLLDGKNPTKLLTKTLERLSAFAMTAVETLDDGEIRERLKELEWLLLADIPDREIRADTRAAFAAGQMARLAPLLTEETNALVDESRKLTQLIGEDKKNEPPLMSEKTLLQDQKVKALEKEQQLQEEKQFRLCFNLLMQSFREHTGKPRIFFRLIQFCRVTGYNGFDEIVKWVFEYRRNNKTRWADYYIGLSLQLLSSNILDATRVSLSASSLRSEKKFAKRFLENLTKLNCPHFSVRPEKEKWYHRAAKNEFIVALVSASHEFSEIDPELSRGLQGVARQYGNLSLTHSPDEWLHETSFELGVWAHHVENKITSSGKQSSIWRAFERLMNFNHRASQLAIRRYPLKISDNSWGQLTTRSNLFEQGDQGWLADSLVNFSNRIKSSPSSNSEEVNFVASVLERKNAEDVDLVQWVNFIRDDCSAFDPRGGEWTSLEIIRQLLSDRENVSIQGDEVSLDELNPRNITLPVSWMKQYSKSNQNSTLSWEKWRKTAVSNAHTMVRHANHKNRLHDYRFSPRLYGGGGSDKNEREITGIGRLLFGLLRKNFESPNIWNIRGNELIYPFPSLREMEVLPISSKTSLILESCLSRRSKETRLMPSVWQLFGMKMGEVPNDTELDPSPVRRVTDLIEHIELAQADLESNQIAVTENQPRQLIPFNLTDFSTNLDEQVEEIVGE